MAMAGVLSIDKTTSTKAHVKRFSAGAVPLRSFADILQLGQLSQTRLELTVPTTSSKFLKSITEAK